MMGAFLSVVLLSVGLHHGEADPTLLEWIMTALSHILLGTLGFTELTVVIIIGIIILAMPALIVGALLGQHAGQPLGAGDGQRTGSSGRGRGIATIPKPRFLSHATTPVRPLDGCTKALLTGSRAFPVIFQSRHTSRSW